MQFIWMKLPGRKGIYSAMYISQEEGAQTNSTAISYQMDSSSIPHFQTGHE